MTTTIAKRGSWTTDDDDGIVVSPGVRLRSADENNTTIEVRQENGVWKVRGYYGSIALAAGALLGRHLGLLVGNGRRDVRSLITAIEAAEGRLLAALARAEAFRGVEVPEAGPSGGRSAEPSLDRGGRS